MSPAWLNDLQDERRVRLSHLFSVGDHFHYTYDFGDNWRHEVLVEKVEPPEVGAAYPRCTGGRRACPPEDSVGAWGYAEMVSALGDPDHEQHVDAIEWLGATHAGRHTDSSGVCCDICEPRCGSMTG